ncbi:nicotinamide-nucleotide amidohydrolase family protein [Candidatus Aerophobetes bacterium]|nr:nicotinamide-nucleotide amidohydrolase family protein [Candidatus Aerophobetes bacterium]
MNKIVIVLPGVPAELQAMTASVASYLSNKIPAQKTLIKSLTLKVFGLGESQVNEKIASLMSMTNPTVALLAKKGEVHIRITAKFTLDEAEREIKNMEKIIREKLGDYIFGTDDETMEEVVGKLLIDKNIKISLAESCSGGLVAHRLTNVPGISASLLCAVVSYSNEAKSTFLKVSSELIKEKGAVSSEVAREMARGISALTCSDVSVGITGIAGPGGGTSEKPVGLVYIALNTEDKDISHKYYFSGTRDMIKWRTSQATLDLIRRYILGKI